MTGEWLKNTVRERKITLVRTLGLFACRFGTHDLAVNMVMFTGDMMLQLVVSFAFEITVGTWVLRLLTTFESHVPLQIFELAIVTGTVRAVKTLCGW